MNQLDWEERLEQKIELGFFPAEIMDDFLTKLKRESYESVYYFYQDVRALIIHVEHLRKTAQANRQFSDSMTYLFVNDALTQYFDDMRIEAEERNGWILPKFEEETI